MISNIQWNRSEDVLPRCSCFVGHLPASQTPKLPYILSPENEAASKEPCSSIKYVLAYSSDFRVEVALCVFDKSHSFVGFDMKSCCAFDCGYEVELWASVHELIIPASIEEFLKYRNS